MTPLRWFTLLATVSVGVLGCTTQESIAPSTAPAPTTTSPVSTGAATTPPSTAPATSTPPTTAADVATTLPPTTTTPPPSGLPITSSRRYFAGGDEDGWLYLGRWTGNSWERAGGDDGPTSATSTADSVVIHELGIDPIQGNVGATIELCPDTRTGPIISPNARAPEVPGFGYRSIAFDADWDTMPRPMAIVDADVPSYRTSAIGAIESENFDVDASSGDIEQIVVTDLDGDGDSESLVAYAGSDFATLLLIDADSGDSVVVAVDGAVDPEPRPVATSPGSAATTTTTTVPPDPIAQFRVLAVADLNGDGLMEFVIHEWNSEDEALATVVTFDGRDVNPVLSAGCSTQ